MGAEGFTVATEECWVTRVADEREKRGRASERHTARGHDIRVSWLFQLLLFVVSGKDARQGEDVVISE